MIDTSPENPSQEKYLKTKQKQKSTNLDTFTLKTKDKEENLRDNQRKKDIAIRRKTQ